MIPAPQIDHAAIRAIIAEHYPGVVADLVEQRSDRVVPFDTLTVQAPIPGAFATAAARAKLDALRDAIRAALPAPWLLFITVGA